MDATPPDREIAVAGSPPAADTGRLPGAVLFVCTHNAIRSPICEWLLKASHGDRVYVDSAGIHAGEVDPLAIIVMAEIGIDLGRHHPKDLDVLYGSSFDVVITLTPEAHHRALEMTRTIAVDVEYWPTFDPTAVEGSRDALLDAFRQLRDQLKARLEARFPTPDQA